MLKLFCIDIIIRKQLQFAEDIRDMKNIIKDIEKNDWKRVYLIYGEEKYLVRNIKNKLVEGIVSKDDNMNFSKFAGKDCTAKEVIEIADTLPFFAEHRLVLIEDSGWLKSGNDEAAEYIRHIPESTVILFVESEVDKRNKVYKQIKSAGYVCECSRMNNSELSKWILVRLNKENKKITKENMNYLLDKLGNDMDNITSELDKLVSYTMGREVIEAEDIDKVCISEITGRIFDMVDAIGNKNQRKALDLYYDLVAVREAPMKILYMLARQFNIMLQVKEMSLKGIQTGEMAKKMGLQNFIINKTLSQCRNFKLSVIRNAVNDCLKLEETVKLGNMNDKMAVELIIVKYS